MPLVLSVSALDPASIQTPTVDVCAHGECSVAICNISQLQKAMIEAGHTVRPFDRVVLWVLMPWWIGVAKPLLMGVMDFRAARLRNAWLRLRANRREAMTVKVRQCVGESTSLGALVS